MGVGGGEFLPTMKRAAEIFDSEVKVNNCMLCPDGAVIGVDGNAFLHRGAADRRLLGGADGHERVGGQLRPRQGQET